MRPIKPKTTLQKLFVVIKYIKNWHFLLKDKLFDGENIIYHFRNGTEIECRRKSTDVNESVVVLSGIEYPEELCVFEKNKQSSVFDVGANIGAFSVFLANINKHDNFKVYAFEPSKENLSLYEANAQRSRLKNFICIEKAISGSDGVANFDVSGGFDAFRIDETDTAGIQVQTTKLSTYCTNNNIKRINLLKMDIEGSEFDVVHHDALFICQYVDTIFMEYHLTKVQQTVDPIIDVLQPYFDISFENVHERGGMIIATKKAHI